MKVFWWTQPFADQPGNFWHAAFDTGSGVVQEVLAHNVGPEMIREMLEDGYVEISAATAFKMGLPS